MNLFKKISDLQNIKKAYLELNKKFNDNSKTFKYSGVDGLTMNDINFNSLEIIKQCQKEIINLSPLYPVKCVYIPKKNGSLRDIYIYSLKDRIKAQAIYRVLEPIFEKQYSKFLFSYRSSHSCYYAARSVARRYKRYYNEDYVGIIDVTNYFYYIDHELLIEKLKTLNFEKDIIELLKIFIRVKIYKDKKKFENNVGCLAGSPLSVLFGNLYLSDIDKKIGSRVSFYRRVGDDLILFDKNKQKLQKTFLEAKEEIKKLKLKTHKKKTVILKANEKFTFLGYNFNNGSISFPDKYVEKLKNDWSNKILSHIPQNEENKKRKLYKILYDPHNNNNLNRRIIQIISQKPLINNYKQLKEIDQIMLKLLTKYFFKSYSQQKQRLLKKKLKNFPLPLMSQYYLKIQNGKAKITTLSLSRNQKRKKTRKN